MRSWTGTIIGQPCSKANSRKVAKIRGKWRVIKSEKALAYVEAATTQLGFTRARPLLEGPVRVTMTVYYPDMRSDLDESLILDVLQGFVYVNDRYVVEKHIHRGAHDHRNPRTEILVEEVEWNAKGE